LRVVNPAKWVVSSLEDMQIYSMEEYSQLDDALLEMYLPEIVGARCSVEDERLARDYPEIVINAVVDLLPGLSSECNDNFIVKLFYPIFQWKENNERFQIVDKLIKRIDSATKEKAYKDIVNRLLKDLEWLRRQMKSVRLSCSDSYLKIEIDSSLSDGLKIVSALVWLTHHLQKAKYNCKIKTDSLSKYHSDLAHFHTLSPSSHHKIRYCLSLLLSNYSNPPSIDPSIGPIPHPSSPLSTTSPTRVYPLLTSDHILAIKRDGGREARIVQMSARNSVDIEMCGVGRAESEDNSKDKPVYLLVPTLSGPTMYKKYRHWVVDLSTMTALGYVRATGNNKWYMAIDTNLSNKDKLKEIVCKIIDREPRYQYRNHSHPEIFGLADCTSTQYTLKPSVE